jgi:signal transduction histidine kinase
MRGPNVERGGIPLLTKNHSRGKVLGTGACQAGAVEPLVQRVEVHAGGGRVDVLADVRNGTAEISVRDTGVGIAPGDQEAVFEEFRQVGTASKKVEGTGLGLAISRKFIELHGGKIWVTSTVGSGSTFTFTLPLASGAA